ncbi:unnamed protein product [Diatraea saccharalis]|uniref:Uncharacterized protein n=1 Tax=Diatraea saccharalis TaxID=40085 RepID=A0A9N9WCH4_9NEOP|nr:unnamed protein product [Diatraea saccharalis]
MDNVFKDHFLLCVCIEINVVVVLPFIVMPVDADLNRTDVVSPGCELKGLRTWKDICLVRNSLFQHQCVESVVRWARVGSARHDAAGGRRDVQRGQRPSPGLIRGRATTPAAARCFV